MSRPHLLVAVAITALTALPACGDESRPAPAPAQQSRVSERPAGTLVYVSGSNRLTAVDVATGRRRVRKMPAVAQCGPQLHITGGHVVFAGMSKGRTTVFSVPVALDGPPVRLGAAHAFVPSVTPGRVWLAGMNCDRPQMIGVREVTVDGREVAASRRRVPGTWLAAAVRGGLVIYRERTLLVWNPSTGRTRRLTLAAVVAARGDLMIGCTASSKCGDLAIADAATSRTVVARPGPHRRLDHAVALSPDGRQLATPALWNRRWSVALVDTRTGATSPRAPNQEGAAMSRPIVVAVACFLPVAAWAHAGIGAHGGAGGDVEPHALGAFAIELQCVVGFEEVIVAADLNRSVAGVRHHDVLRRAAFVEHDVAVGG